MSEQIYNPIDETASTWLARIVSGRATDAEREALQLWLSADARHQGAYIRASALWRSLDIVGIRASDAPSDTTVVSLDAARTRRDTDRMTTMLSRRRVMVAGGAIAASLAAALVLPNFMRSGSEIFTGSPGRIRQVVLADGSRLHLAGASSVEVAFRDDERRVKLLQGEGWFEVAKDRSRPFIVETGDVSVRAVGTAFSVGRFDGQAEVLVTEGIIDLTTVRGGAVAARMHQGDIAKIGRGGLRLAKLTDEETRRQLAWREGGISLDGETLVQAAAMFNRFNTTQIAIDDTALSKQAVVGWFAFNDPQGFSRAAASMFDADVTRQGNTIRLTRHH